MGTGARGGGGGGQKILTDGRGPCRQIAWVGRVPLLATRATAPRRENEKGDAGPAKKTPGRVGGCHLRVRNCGGRLLEAVPGGCEVPRCRPAVEVNNKGWGVVKGALYSLFVFF